MRVYRITLNMPHAGLYSRLRVAGPFSYFNVKAPAPALPYLNVKPGPADSFTGFVPQRKGRIGSRRSVVAGGRREIGPGTVPASTESRTAKENHRT